MLPFYGNRAELQQLFLATTTTPTWEGDAPAELLHGRIFACTAVSEGSSSAGASLSQIGLLFHTSRADRTWPDKLAVKPFRQGICGDLRSC